MRNFLALSKSANIAIGEQEFSCFPECALVHEAVLIKRLSVQAMAQTGTGTIPCEICVCKVYGTLGTDNKGSDFAEVGTTDIVAGMLIHPFAPVDCDIYVSMGTLVKFDVMGCLKDPAPAAVTVFVFIGIEYDHVELKYAS